MNPIQCPMEHCTWIGEAKDYEVCRQNKEAMNADSGIIIQQLLWPLPTFFPPTKTAFYVIQLIWSPYEYYKLTIQG